MAKANRRGTPPGKTPAPDNGPKRTPRPPKVRKRSIRRSATVSPFGVGAIYDFGDESLVAMDIFHWHNNGQMIRLPRLERELGVTHFLMAPVAHDQFSPYAKKVPYHRFPQWLFCPSCRRMIRWSYKKECPGEQPKCELCPKRSRLVPMRFVVACKGGHLTDLPWDRWAHSNGKEHAQLQCQDSKLTFETRRAGGGGLGSLWIVCQTCRSSRSLYGIARKDSLKGVVHACENRQPWEWKAGDRQPCEHFPQVLQRGATNLYFPRVPSALDIPDVSSANPNPLADNIRGHNYYQILKDFYTSTTDPDNNPAVGMTVAQITKGLKCTETDVLDILRADLSPTSSSQPKGPEGLLREEWDAFVHAQPTEDPKAPFITEIADLTEMVAPTPEGHPFRSLAACLDRVVLARRLREVRALEGFERQEPGSTLIRPALDRSLTWLPGIEVFGEGIFLALNEEKLTNWESANRQSIEVRLRAMEERRRVSSLSFLPGFSPRFVVLHTLAHILIRQLSFECGYAASSLRERIFSATPQNGSGGMAGILIYTAEGDSEGSLGGLVREGQPERLLPTMLMALQTAGWCSADPICRELAAQGLQGLNRAACHACALVSETSCVCANVMLDRAVLVGDDSGLPGYFSAVCQDIESLTGEGKTS